MRTSPVIFKKEQPMNGKLKARLVGIVILTIGSAG
jgi:hypothetical protein